MRGLGKLDLPSEYRTHIFVWLQAFSLLGYLMGMLHRELIFLVFLIHVSVNGIIILLGLLLREILAQCPHPTSSHAPDMVDGLPQLFHCLSLLFHGPISGSLYYLPG